MEKCLYNDKIVNDCISIHGFLLYEDLFKIIEIMDEYCPKTDLPIAEVGVYCGRTTRLLAEYGHVIGIDAYMNDPEAYSLIKRSELFNQARHKYLFDAEIWNMTSIEGAKKTLDNNMKFKAIFIDASHDYESIKQDLEAWFPLLSDDGFIFGDDYTNSFEGVKRATEEFFKEDLKITSHQKIWYCKKKG